MQYLAKRLAFEQFEHNGRVPYQKNEFPKLSSMCVKVITENFTLYPDLSGLPEDIKDQVFFIIQQSTIRSTMRYPWTCQS